MRSIMQHDFSYVPDINIPRSQFDRSFSYKTAFDAGYLIPFFYDDVLPGDTYNLNTTGFARLATPFFPVMDSMYMDTHFFFVPLRLVWDNARKFFGEQVDPGDSISYTIPVMTSHVLSEETLGDYFGLPINDTGTLSVEYNSIYHRGYNLIWNEYFRDQNLQDSVVVDTDDGPDTYTDYVLLKRGKRFDYFTSCLTAPQKGDAVSIPLGTTAPLEKPSPYNADQYFQAGSIGAAASGAVSIDAGGHLEDSGSNDLWVGLTDMYADLSSATAATINDLREAFQVQKLLERDAMGGTRYSELIRNHFNVDFYDISYRPEFLGGGSSRVNITPVATTTDAGTYDVGDLAGYGTTSFTGHGFTKTFREHGFVIGLVSVRADLHYQQGLDRSFLKQDRYDIYWPSLAHLGNQEVLNAEIYYQNTSADDDVFGYQERYAEYRYKPSRITGRLRSNLPFGVSSLDAWHLAQDFASLPVLGNTFIQESPPIDRVVQVNTEPHFIFDSYTSLKCARPMPMYGTPGLIDHF